MADDYDQWASMTDLPSGIGVPWRLLQRANSAAVTASGLIAGRRSYLTGFSLTETSGTASASVQLISGQTSSGLVLATVNLAPSESAREYLPYPWLEFRAGIFVNVVSGAVVGSVSSLTIPEA